MRNAFSLLVAGLVLGNGAALAASAENGKIAFVKHGCWQCHGFEGQGSVATSSVAAAAQTSPTAAPRAGQRQSAAWTDFSAGMARSDRGRDAYSVMAAMAPAHGRVLNGCIILFSFLWVKHRRQDRRRYPMLLTLPLGNGNKARGYALKFQSDERKIRLEMLS